jgi:hypothetical protein
LTFDDRSQHLLERPFRAHIFIFTKHQNDTMVSQSSNRNGIIGQVNVHDLRHRERSQRLLSLSTPSRKRNKQAGGKQAVKQHNIPRRPRGPRSRRRPRPPAGAAAKPRPRASAPTPPSPSPWSPAPARRPPLRRRQPSSPHRAGRRHRRPISAAASRVRSAARCPAPAPTP